MDVMSLADQVRGLRRNELARLPRAKLGRTGGGLACDIHTVDGKDVLGKIDPDGNNSHGLPLLSELMKSSRFPSWQLVAGRRSLRLARDEEVLFIR